ncbi:MAG: DTW domain-containing protein [Deltaproteobacteria bacterium]|jgi:DTW domain-containing protein|nr:DTW domain-containing protein [Deltaproteobacteria bacterium]
MGTRSKRSDRCPACRMHVADCLCALIPKLDLETRVIVVMHHREWSKPTATAPLFSLAAPNSEIRLRGRQDQPFSSEGIVTHERRTLLLYPSDDAEILTPELVKQDPRPVTLVVPDGSWRQAAKSTQREPVLKGLSRVTLPDMGPTRYRLRNEPKPGGLGTFEAISRALRILEGEETYLALDALFNTMVERTLTTRGQPTTDKGTIGSA